MGLPTGNTRAKIYSTSVIEITFLLFAYCYFYISSISNQNKKQNKTKNKTANSQTTKTDAVSVNIVAVIIYF